MCQLNIYALPKGVQNEEVITIFQHYDTHVDEQHYYKLDELDERYKLFSTSYHCDCGSIISRLQYENASSFSEYQAKKKKEDAEKLNRMKTLKGMKDYEKNSDLEDSIYYDIAVNERIISEYDFSDYNEKYIKLKNIYGELLNLVAEICIYPFWQDGKADVINERRQVEFELLRIEDLVFLPYRNLLTIRKA
jgi:hypothetical protein